MSNPAQIGFFQMRPAQVEAVQFSAAQHCAPQIPTSQVGAPQIGAGEVEAGKALSGELSLRGEHVLGAAGMRNAGVGEKDCDKEPALHRATFWGRNDTALATAGGGPTRRMAAHAPL